MLTITIINIGGDEIADYSYLVTANREIIAQGAIKNHNRADGWRALVRRLLEEGE